MLLSLATAIDRLNSFIGKACSWLTLFMVVVMTINVFMRYLFAMGDPWQQELVRYMHAIVFLAGAGYALKDEAHVRVDVLYHNFPPVKRAWVNLLGTLLLLFPVAFSLIYFSYAYVMSSWNIFEGSSEYHGMPGVFAIKSFIWICGGVLILQGISMVLHSLHTIRTHEPRRMIVED